MLTGMPAQFITGSLSRFIVSFCLSFRGCLKIAQRRLKDAQLESIIFELLPSSR